MKAIFFFICILMAVVSCCFAAPFESTRISKVDAELKAGYFEGDIVLDTTNRNALRAEERRWPWNVVPYIIHRADFTQAHIDHIEAAMRLIESVTCVVFREVSHTEIIYVNITGVGNGCYSNVGFLNRIQNLNLQPDPIDTDCFRMGTIVHELLHTLGLIHQHNTANRDEYVRIAEENLYDNHYYNFYKYQENQVDDMDEEYDYSSIMHFSAYAFSKNGEMTIVPLKEGIDPAILGQRDKMTQSDINKINKMYRCRVHM